MVDQARRHVVLIIDEVQQAVTSDDGNQTLLALEAARDAVNQRPDTPGHFILLGTGSPRALVAELTARRNQAFAGATSVPYLVVGSDYVGFLLQRLAQEGATDLPSLQVATQAFATLGHRPEEMLKALRQLRPHVSTGRLADDYLPVIAATLRSSSAEIELAKVEQLGSLASAIFGRIAAAHGDARGVFSAEAAAAYSLAVGRPVRIEEAQPVVNELLGANMIMRKGHGHYAITDPFVQGAWRDLQALRDKA